LLASAHFGASSAAVACRLPDLKGVIMFDNLTSRRRERKAARILNERPQRVVNEELRILMSTVQDLVDRLGTAADPELKRLREQAEAALARARAAVGEGGAVLGEQARQLAEQGQRYVRRRPLTSLGLVAVSMLAIGLLTGRSMATD
jgi:ElaB/YqjD/DUF883 family membrane-anchored ribosome-binding protein